MAADRVHIVGTLRDELVPESAVVMVDVEVDGECLAVPVVITVEMTEALLGSLQIGGRIEVVGQYEARPNLRAGVVETATMFVASSVRALPPAS